MEQFFALIAIVLGFAIGVISYLFILLPLFYDLPRAVAGAWRKEFKLLVAGKVLAIAFFWYLAISLLAICYIAFVPGGIQWIVDNPFAFRTCPYLGTLAAFLYSIFSRSARSAIRVNFIKFTRPYRL